MKRKSISCFSEFIFIFISLFFQPLHSRAESFDEWGIKAGVSFSNQEFKYKTAEIERNFDDYFGLNLDLFVNAINRKSFGLLGQISFSQKGCIESITPTFVDPLNHGYIEGEQIHLKNRTDYISFSVLGKLNWAVKTLNPYVIFGPRIDFLISTKSRSKIIYDNLNKNNIGLSLGIGNQFNAILPYKTLIEFQYSPDLTKIYDTPFLSIEKKSCELKLGIIF